MIELACITLLAAAISVGLGVYAAVRCARYERQSDVQFFVDRDPRWGYRR